MRGRADDNEYTLEYLLAQPAPESGVKAIENGEESASEKADEEDVDMDGSEGEWEGVQSDSE